MPRICHALLRTPRYGGQAFFAAASGLTLVLSIACSKPTPAPALPEVTPPSAGETINGTERIGWLQRAADAAELSSLRYTIWVDGARSELTGAS